VFINTHSIRRISVKIYVIATSMEFMPYVVKINVFTGSVGDENKIP
jgi:hypothetical protein